VRIETVDMSKALPEPLNDDIHRFEVNKSIQRLRATFKSMIQGTFKSMPKQMSMSKHRGTFER
jgi:hypothetical protein